MSIVTEEYLKAKKLGDKLGWDSNTIHDHVNEKVQQRIKELTNDLIDTFNFHGSQDVVIDGIIDGITSSHRYLQSEFWSAMIKVMEKYSDLPEHCFDPRNALYKTITKRMARVAHDPDYDNN